ncbi:hypothetical protein SAMN05216319_5090 [Duganella sp. CF402]|uniref:hypothetical protein n=1 Tax=unclassified Duganella TaxID=2636909 RepID=UPI0008D646C4|nr:MULTISPECIES: hypothetical protein [unclassified Duganella]RZT05614.1 hypothetical protein EV582_3929 [Duganella sp. BK701]SEM97395.1 hypothetical protein SAMN05216319_5090 [Duganella sp. CF402]
MAHFRGVAGAFALVVLSACSFRGFKPPPPAFESYVRAGASGDDVKRSMLACGYRNVFITDRDETLNDLASHENCMFSQGYRHPDGWKGLCSRNYEQDLALPACVEKKQGYPVSLDQLKALPFYGDAGFARFSQSESHFTESDRITWRRADSSLDFRQVGENQRIALPVMYECAYPQPLGSNTTEVTVDTVVKAQVCMQNRGFIPAGTRSVPHPMIPICRWYPKLPECQ